MDNPIRLELIPDFDDMNWTHLRGPGTTMTLLELPDLLMRKITPFIRTLIDKRIQRLIFEQSRLPLVNVDDRLESLAVYARNPEYMVQNLELAAWWLEYQRIRSVCRPTVIYKNPHTIWHCPDCLQEVQLDRDLCTNPGCVSWDKIFQCTGETRFRPVVIRCGITTS